MTGINQDRDPVEADHEPITIKPIGYVHSGYLEPTHVAHTRRGWTDDASTIRLLDQHKAALSGLQGYSHLIVLYWIHRSREWKMPKDHNKPSHVKVFATRMPVRPNPIAMSVVELLGFSTETGEIEVRGLDALDGAPVLDVKPYIPDFDCWPGACIPDWVERHLRSHFHSGAGHSESPPETDNDITTRAHPGESGRV